MLGLNWGRRRYKKALARPFPGSWRQMLTNGMVHWRTFDAAEHSRLEDLIRIILADKYWEASQGFNLTEEMRVLIAALAAVPVLNLDYDYYHEVSAIIVVPGVFAGHGDQVLGDGLRSDDPLAIIGEATSAGPVILSWDSVRQHARHPEAGRNVVYHEFAHKLDMLDGSIDGTPAFETKEQYRQWVEVCRQEYRQLQYSPERSLLDSYGATNPGEFFAVTTEVFFNRPAELQVQKPKLYGVMRDFYRQDPAARQWRARG